jgi:hypothetical protein
MAETYHQMKIAKADKEDIESTMNFLQAAEMALERSKYGMRCAESNWEQLDDDDADMIMIQGIRKRMADDDGCEPHEVDNRLLMYEFLQRKFRAASSSWRRVVWGCDALIDTFCDPTVDHLESLPGIDLMHVAPEQ